MIDEEKRAQEVYASIPGIRERALRARQARNQLQGQRIEDAASTPYVEQTQTRHEPMTGWHNHDHGAYEADDHDDGIHAHLHWHDGDAMHSHSHALHEPPSNMVPGRH